MTNSSLAVLGAQGQVGSAAHGANNGRLLREKFAEGLAEAGKALLKDARGTAGWDEKAARIKMKIPGLDETLAMDGVVLGQTDKSVILSPKTNSAALFYGVSIIPRNEVEFGPL